jgi:integrase
MNPNTPKFLNEWLNAVSDGKSPRTGESYAYAARKLFTFLEAHSHPTDLELLRPFHLRAFFATLRTEGMAANSIAAVDRPLRAIFSRVDREGRDDFDLPASWKNPFAAVEKNRPQGIRKTPLGGDEVRRLLQTLPRRGFIAYRNFAQIAFMLMTGARSIEVRHLRLSDLSLEQGYVELRVTKGGKRRIVFVPGRLARVMGAYLRRRERLIRSDLVFPTREGGLQSRRSLHRTVQRAGHRIGRTDLGPHRLRHSYVTLSHAKGAPLKFLQEQCGHSSVLVTQGYINLSDAQKSELAERYAI